MVAVISELQYVTLHHRNFTFSKAFRSVWSLSQSGSYSAYCNNGPQPTQPQQTFIFLIRKFLAPRQSHWLQFVPCDQANFRFPLSGCSAGCSKRLHGPPVSKTKPQRCNYNTTINPANQPFDPNNISAPPIRRERDLCLNKTKKINKYKYPI